MRSSNIWKIFNMIEAILIPSTTIIHFCIKSFLFVYNSGINKCIFVFDKYTIHFTYTLFILTIKHTLYSLNIIDTLLFIIIHISIHYILILKQTLYILNLHINYTLYIYTIHLTEIHLL